MITLQVSTPTGSVSHYYNLGIIVPRAYILGADEYVTNQSRYKSYQGNCDPSQGITFLIGMIEMRLRYYAMAGGDISLVCIIEDVSVI